MVCGQSVYATPMVQIHFQFHEIEDWDFTAVDIILGSDNGFLERYANYDRASLTKQIWGNQSEVFQLPTMEIARAFVASAGEYHRVI